MPDYNSGQSSDSDIDESSNYLPKTIEEDAILKIREFREACAMGSD